MSIVGARPQFVKLSPIAEALRLAGHDHYILHTGQHYDTRMSESFFEELDIPTPDANLGIGSGSHGEQTGAMLAGIEKVLFDISTDWVLVFGDTNSTLAGALAATKLHRRVAHLEAGLRSFNRRMPEELNRVATDHLSDLLFAPTETSARHLANEGLTSRTVVSGDVMTDVCLRVSRRVGMERPRLPVGIQASEDFVVATIHRPDNTDDPQRLSFILGALGQVETPVVLAAHPRLVSKAQEFGLSLNSYGIFLREPFTYPEMVAALKTARGVVTDSGGLQKEAYLLHVPCTTIRTETEWTETLANDWNVLDPSARSIPVHAARTKPDTAPAPVYGDGMAAQRVVAALSAT